MKLHGENGFRNFIDGGCDKYWWGFVFAFIDATSPAGDVAAK